MIIDKRHISTAEMREAVLKAYHVVGRPNPHKSDIDSIAIGLLKVTKAVKEMPEYKCWDSELHYQFEWCRTYLTNEGYLTESDQHGVRNLIKQPLEKR